MKEVFDAKYVSLHVRESNRAALTLYRDRLGFQYVFSYYFCLLVRTFLELTILNGNITQMVRMPTPWHVIIFPLSE